MPNPHPPRYDDLQLLDDASRSLLGFFLHRWFREYLVVVNQSIRGLYENALITSLTAATERGRRALFDVGALGLDKLSFLVGTYLYIYLCHKFANYRLMNRFAGKQVLFLRGYDFEAAISSEVGVAASMPSTDTMQFGAVFRRLLERDFRLFKVGSPMDLYWETIDAQHHFGGEYDGLQRLVGQRPASVYLNAQGWQEGVLHLLDRMDHYIVYVSSITASALWELEQLDTEPRRQRVTVVFDDEAIADKEGRAEFPRAFASKVGFQVAWAKEGSPPTRTASELREHLSARFLVISKDDFEAHIDRHRERIRASASPLQPGSRENWIDFRFHPAVAPDRLAELYDIDEGLGAATAAIAGGIESLPLALAQVQLRIYATLLLGRHENTGDALAAYAGIMRGALDYCARGRDRSGEPGAETDEDLLSTLQMHHDFGRQAGLTLAACGKSHEFESIFAATATAFEATYDATRAAVGRYFAQRDGGGAAHA
jgi:hypothetical protein